MREAPDGPGASRCTWCEARRRPTESGHQDVEDDARAAALAERERIATLAERCHATYEGGFKVRPFADLIRSGAGTPPWWDIQVTDPLASPTGGANGQ